MKKTVIIVLTAVFVAVSGIFYACSKEDVKDDDIRILSEDETEHPTAVPTPVPNIFVHVCGAVVNPDVYEIPKGSRVREAVDAAGGCTDSADADYLNLAEFVSDGQKIYVPTKEETKNLGFGEKISISESGGNTRVNINRATEKELTALPGIGEGRAKEIVAYRKKAGNFQSIEEIKNVSGIGDSIFSRIRDYIYVD